MENVRCDYTAARHSATTAVSELNVETSLHNLEDGEKVVPKTGYVQHIYHSDVKWFAIDRDFDDNVSSPSNFDLIFVPKTIVLSESLVYVANAERSNVINEVQPESIIQGCALCAASSCRAFVMAK